MNEYISPDHQDEAWEGVRSDQRIESLLPGFVKAVAIIDLVLITIRALMTPLSILGFSVMQPEDPLRTTVMFEIGCHVSIFSAGLVANIGILRKSVIGLYAGYASLVVTLLSFIVGAWQLSIQIDAFTEPAQKIAAMAGGGIVMIIRIAILVVYFIALLQFKRYLMSNDKLNSMN